jgi:peptide subunit release factor 1 (eRF1)
LLPDKIKCAYCKKDAELMASNNRTAVICRECGIAVDLETYKELFDDLIYEKDDHGNMGAKD